MGSNKTAIKLWERHSCRHRSGKERPSHERPARKRITPALVAAMVAHGVFILALAAIPLHRAWIAPKFTPASVSFTFVGMAGGGGNPNAGGRAPAEKPSPKIVEAPQPPPVVTPPPPPPVVEPPPVIAVATTEPVAELPAAPVNTNAPVAVASASVGGRGTGSGHGTGTGEGDGSAAGIAGSGGEGNVGFGRPDYLRAPKPLYPASALRAGWEGTTVLRVEVSANGTPSTVMVIESSGHRVLDKAAIEAVRSARFQPARYGSAATNSWVEVPISFRLNRG
jgi:TonB family protein